MMLAIVHNEMKYIVWIFLYLPCETTLLNSIPFGNSKSIFSDSVFLGADRFFLEEEPKNKIFIRNKLEIIK